MPCKTYSAQETRMAALWKKLADAEAATQRVREEIATALSNPTREDNGSAKVAANGKK